MPTSEVSKSSRSSYRNTTAIWGNWYTTTRSVVRRRTTLQKVCTLYVSFVLSVDVSLAAVTVVARVLRAFCVLSPAVSLAPWQRSTRRACSVADPFFCRSARFGNGDHLVVDRGSMYHPGCAGVRNKEMFQSRQAHEYFKQQFPTSQPARAAASLLRAMARCTMGCDMAAPYTEGQDVGSVKTAGVSLGALSAPAAREALATSGDKRRRGDMDTWSGFRGEDLIDMSFEKMADKYERTLKAAG